ncbi:MAG: hypothetical protein RIR68_1461, partial [Pseudomonadota bacterium]
QLILLATMGIIGWLPNHAVAHEDSEIESQFKKLSKEEAAALRDILAAPLDTGAIKTTLENQIMRKRMAAKRLSDYRSEEQLLLEALPFVKEPGMYLDLSLIYVSRGEYAKAVETQQEAVKLANGAQKTFHLAHLANRFYSWGRNDQCRKTLDETRTLIDSFKDKNLSPSAKRVLLRGTTRYYQVLSNLEQRFGQWDKAIDAAMQAEQAARQSMNVYVEKDNELMRLVLASDVGNALATRTQALREARRLNDAEDAMREYMRFAANNGLPQKFRSGIYSTAASLRFSQREFIQSEQLFRKSDQILETLGETGISHLRAQRTRSIFISLAAQQRWVEALQLIEKIDQSTAGNESAQKRTQFSFDRGYVYLGNQKNAEAAPLFASVAKWLAKNYDEGHYLTAQAKGMQGVALWRSTDSKDKVTGLELLESSVSSMVHPRNSDYLDQYGIRPEIRQMIIGTYIEALSQSQPEKAKETLGLADWLKSGSVQEALSDAAVRAAANTEGLSVLVRSEQDVKNEIKGLRTYLEGEVGGAQSALPEVVAQMRERIRQLEKQRSNFQTEIKKAFPGYDRLVRPLPPTLNEISSKLKADEALLVFMPDVSGVNVWAVSQQKGVPKAQFHRANISQKQLSQSVATLRASLESFGNQGKVSPFDDKLAYQVYQTLIEPVNGTLNGKTQWIVASSGALARIPFAVLQSKARQGQEQPSWLIKDVSLSQVPSVSAWLSLRSLQRRQAPQQQLIAWGDPIFNPALKAPTAANQVRNISFTRSVSNDLEKDAPKAGELYHSIPALPETRDELLALAKALKANPQSDLIMGQKATRENVIQANAEGKLFDKKVIAFATHGLMAGDLPRLTQPALALSANGKELQSDLAPLLTLEDVLTLKLNADWVILSACNTAASDGKAEEALSGLARGFFYAGSRSMLVTHWAVESESAKEITTKTFDHFTQNPQAPKASSLRNAMLEVMNTPQFAHPAFWAPYVLVGDSAR